MNYKFNILYPILVLVLVLSYIITVVFSRITGHFDLVLVVYFYVYDMIDEDNYIPVSCIFGIFADFVRGGFFGPAVIIFLLYSYIRFKAELVMDMTKFNSKVILFTFMSLVYCSFNLFITGYESPIILQMTILRTLLNVGLAVFIIRITRYSRAAENA